ncbi:MAG: DUF3093 domain-containing protein [Actinomycetes bacterium]
MRTYDEKLTPPVSLYAAGWGMALLLGVSFYAALGPVAGLLATGVPGGLVTVLLARSGAVVRVEDGHLTAGPAHIPVDALGPARALDAGQSRRVRGPASDPAGYHLIRGWIPAGVQADVIDPADPTPYWFVASRRPQALADAVEAARQQPFPRTP